MKQKWHHITIIIKLKSHVNEIADVILTTKIGEHLMESIVQI